LVRDRFYNILLHVAGQIGKDLCCPILGQGAENHDHMLPLQLLHEEGNVSILQHRQFSSYTFKILICNQTF